MISVFRRVRRSSLFQNRITRYLIYAFGEIILVMIGILLAVQVNDYQKDQERLKKEQFYLRSLKADLDSTFLEMDRAIRETGEILDYSDITLRLMAGDSVIDNGDSILANIFGSLDYTHSGLTDGTISEITYSGNLGIISNDTIRRFIVNWPKNLERLREFEKLAENSYLAVESRFQSFLDMPTVMIGKKEFSFSEAMDILGNKNLRNEMGVHAIRLSWLSRTYEQYNRNFEDIYAIIQREIRKGPGSDPDSAMNSEM